LKPFRIPQQQTSLPQQWASPLELVGDVAGKGLKAANNIAENAAKGKASQKAVGKLITLPTTQQEKIYVEHIQSS
jgi:hypothetical protein